MATSRSPTALLATSTLQKPAPTATALLMLHGVPHLWKLVSGEWEAQVELLNASFPFRVEVALIAPKTVPDAVNVALEAFHRLKATPCENGWFMTDYNTAALALNATMPANPGGGGHTAPV